MGSTIEAIKTKDALQNLEQESIKKRDYDGYTFWLTKSAEQGFSVALFYLATCYEKAAERNLSEAQYKLAIAIMRVMEYKIL